VAHLEAVTSLAVDQHGLYLISGSHDCSIRSVIDNLLSRICILLCYPVAVVLDEPYSHLTLLNGTVQVRHSTKAGTVSVQSILCSLSGLAE
jgi:hypothetical protein